jgi:hypothetical protein
MRSIRNRGHARPPAASGSLVARWGRRLTAGAVTLLAAVGLVAGSVTAASAQPVPPAAKVTPAVVDGNGIVPIYFYTAINGTVWTKTETGPATRVSNGVVVSAVSGLFNGSTIILFGQGPDNALWVTHGFGTSWANWTSLGGILTSAPGAVWRGSASVYAVFVRGTNGAVWARDHSASGWGGWHSDGGNLLAGTAPSAAFLGGITWIQAVGTNRQIYIAEAGLTGFSSAGGQTLSTAGLTTVPGALVGFARGTDNVAYYHRYASTTPGWHSMGGLLTSGLAAGTDAIGGTLTSTAGLGTDSQVWFNGGNWAFGNAPHLFGWSPITP